MLGLVLLLNAMTSLCSVDPIQQACGIYCHGPILEAVQSAKLFNDSKTFVDMPMKHSPSQVELAFAQASPSTREEVAKFVAEHFAPAGTELVDWTPPDWSEKPLLLENISDASLRSWVIELNKLWLTLGRKVVDAVWTHPERHSLIPVHNGLIIPGMCDCLPSQQKPPD